jgi:outer membrane protein assembly factor BamB
MRNRWLRLCCAVVSPAIACGLLVSTVPVQAAGTAHLLLAPNDGPPTSTVKALGSGYPPADSVNIVFDSTQVATATSSLSGAFTTPFKVPAAAMPGVHQVTAFDNAGIGSMAIFAVRTDWADSRFDPSGGGFNQYENVLSPSNVGGLVQRSAPQVGAFLHSAPIYIQGNLVAGFSDGTFRAFNPLNGNQIWSFTTGGAIEGSPVAVTTRQGAKPCAVVAASIDGGIYAVNAGSGRLLWSAATGAPISGSPVAFALPAVQRLVTVNGNGNVDEFNACTGTPIWSDITGNSPVPNSTPAVVPAVQLPDGTTHTIIVVCFGGSVEAIDGGTGALLWSVTGIAPTSSPTVYGSGTGARILLGEDPTAVELNASTGKQVWSTSIDGGITGGIALYKAQLPGTTKFTLQAVIAGDSNGNLYSFNPKTGVINWKDPGPTGSPAEPLSSVAIANGVAYVMKDPGPQGSGQNGTLLAVNAGSGSQLFSADEADLNPQPFPPAPPSISDGMVFTGDFGGGIRVYGLPG